jgi:hypothetical protein
VSHTLSIAYWDALGGSWSRYALPWNGTGTAGQVSLAVGSTGAYLTAYDNGSADLHLINATPGQFSSRVVASTGTVGKSNSVTMNPVSGQKCLTFSDQTMGVLNFAAF